MKIQILMSAYNGSQYIKTQMDSIAAQEFHGHPALPCVSQHGSHFVQKQGCPQDTAHIALLVRDDGSTDGTPKILESYCSRFPWISYYKGANIGVQRSFLDLIHRADPHADYYAFADQDDEWLPQKLEHAVQCLQGMALPPETPQLYCSAKQIVDQNLDPLPAAIGQQVRRTSFGNALVQNICTGCTAVFNKALFSMIKRHPIRNPQDMVMHDWWLYLAASCFGHVFYDQNTYIRYRQHGANAFGVMLSQRDLLAYRLRELKKPRGKIFRQAALFLETYADLLELPEYRENRQLAANLLACKDSWPCRLKLAFDPRYFRQKRSDDLIFRGIVLIGKL